MANNDILGGNTFPSWHSGAQFVVTQHEDDRCRNDFGRAYSERRIPMKPLLIAVIPLFLFGCKGDDTTSPSDPKAGLQTSSLAIVNAYVNRAKAVGFTPTFTPQVLVQTLPQLTAYSAGTIYVPDWSEVDQQTRSLFEQWAGYAGGGTTGESLFQSLFNIFFIAHETTHYFQEALNRQGIYFVTEQDANDFAVAFWMVQPNGSSVLNTVKQQITQILARLPRPYPQGADPRDYFNKNYNALVQNPVAYGYYQFTMILDSFDYIAANNLTFDSMVRSVL
jgi:hypothetical protein